MKTVGLISAALVIFGLSLFSFAEETEDLEYSWGTVKEASSAQIIVAEYDYDTDEEIDVVYDIDSDTKVLNVDSIEDISAGDSVEIDFMVALGRNLAKVISVERAEQDESMKTDLYMEEPAYSPDEEEY